MCREDPAAVHRGFRHTCNQTLDELGTELVVIGGPNRAGKTTFLQVLRYLGYGFPLRGQPLPPPDSMSIMWTPM